MRVDDLEDVIAWRRHLHQNPELAFEERETAAFVAQRLGEWGPGLASVVLPNNHQDDAFSASSGIR